MRPSRFVFIAVSTVMLMSASAFAAGVTFTEQDLAAYERGLRREIELVRAPAGRGAVVRRVAPPVTQTIAEGAKAAGMSGERYQEIRQAVDEVFTTLSFQGKIDGPRKIDMSRASPAMKARLARDAFADLPLASAQALKMKSNVLVPLWSEYVRLVAVAG